MDLVAALPQKSDAGAHDPFVPVWSGADPEFTEVCGALRQAGIPCRAVDGEDTLFGFGNRPPHTILVPPSMEEAAHKVISPLLDEIEEAEDQTADDRAASGLEESEAGSAEPNDIPAAAGLRRRRILKKAWDPDGLLSGGVTESWSEVLEPRHDEPDTLTRYPVDPDRWSPEDATAEVWRGKAGSAADMIVACLRENGIHWRIGGDLEDDAADVDDDGASKVNQRDDDRTEIFVLPADVDRAREIIREISRSEPL